MAFSPVQATPIPLDIQYEADGDDLGWGGIINMNIPVNDATQPFAGRPLFVTIIVDGNAADSVMSSPVFQKAITSEIINSCGSL
ncbi:hypothetical protein H6F96_19335 [Microcoleus sp. FACHB-53]|nr:hypothetical protein [Microcoleus sp. FACHB-53]